MSIVNDTHLAYLLSLGFDIDLCKQALKQNSSLETATDWILNPSHPPTLNLGMDLSQPHSSSGSLASAPSYLSQNALLKEKQDRELKLQQKKKFEAIQNELKKDKQLEKEARQRAILDIKEDQEKRKLKGLSSSTPRQQQEVLLSERQKLQNKIKKDKQLDREQRQRILQNIKNDKIDKKYKSTLTTTPTLSTPTTITSSSSDTAEAFIQFKLSNGSSLRQKFIATTKVNEIFQFVLGKEAELNLSLTVDKISLVCGFPRRTFTTEDGHLDMKEAGFLPNVSLNVVISKEASVETEDEERSEGVEMDENDEEEDLDEMDLDEEAMSDELDRRMLAMHRRHHAARGPMTSGGHRLSDAPTAVQEEETTADDTVTEDTVMEDEDRRSQILSALEHRNQPMPTTSTTPCNNARTMGKKRNVKTLKDICSIQVTGLLSQHTVTANKYLKKLVYTSSDVAEFLFLYLIKNKQLNVSTLRKLADHCYLQNVILDSYSYCTDSLIEDVCKSNSNISITKLSLRGCDVITDGAIRALEGLKSLMYLDLTNCKVTDKGLKSIEKLRHLSWLNLSKTKITNAGLDSLVNNAKFKNELQVLLLDGCTRLHANDILVPIVDGFINLIQLSYAYTTYKQQQPEKEMKLTNKHVKLEQLDVNHTFVLDQVLVHVISQFRNLVELKLGGCDDITTKSLSFLPLELKRLEFIQFPNREHELDGVLSRYKGLPLKQLDLTGFLNVTDEGVQSISYMKDLRSLSLIGTKVTDEGIGYLKDLAEIETLSLDRTLLTDIGLEKLKGLSKLETLSLCRTGISNEGLCMLGDFEQTSFARNLRTLNLSQCALVTDKGVRGISGMFNLTNLNLDHTGVSKSCLKYLKDLEHLNPVRLQGIEKEEDDTMDMD